MQSVFFGASERTPMAEPLLACQCDYGHPLCTVRQRDDGWSRMSCVACLGLIYEHHDPPVLPDGTQGWTPELLVSQAVAEGITVLDEDGTRIISGGAYKLALETADAINILGEGMLFTEAECTGAPPASEKHPEQSASGRDRRYAHAYKLWMGVAVASYARQHKRKPKTSSDFRKWADYAWNRYMLRSKGISSLSQGDEAEAEVIRASPLPNARLPDLPPPTPTPISPGARQASPTGNPRLQPQTPAARCGLSPSDAHPCFTGCSTIRRFSGLHRHAPQDKLPARRGRWQDLEHGGSRGACADSACLI